MSITTNENKPNQDQHELEDFMKILLTKDCYRCGGLMITEQCFDVESNTGEFEIQIRKCLSCGETIDPTILRNRRRATQNLNDTPQKKLPFSSLPLLALSYWPFAVVVAPFVMEYEL